MGKIEMLYLMRAENEIAAAQILLEASKRPELQKEIFSLQGNFTFYSAVISHCYYSIFFSAKAILAAEGIKTYSPNIHLKTLNAFDESLVKTGKLDVYFLKIYRQMVLRADELLGIFASEKEKRGRFTYRTIPQANLEPAMESMKNALFFFKHINKIIRQD
ncbi:MAG: hypothetical protein QME12_04920 [Nanoarchaeota archaeon]|nr:hypothetical protein [Nanoarchaeota archaeon]